MEKFFLKWNDFQSTICSSFQDILEAGDFFDVTLVCDDRQLQAHRLILSACSPLLRTILHRSNHPHPHLLLRNTQAKHVSSILSFIYQGQVNVSLEDLDSFMATAKELQIRGLSGEEGVAEKVKHLDIKLPKTTKTKFIKNTKTRLTAIKQEKEMLDDEDDSLDPGELVETSLAEEKPDYSDLDRDILEQVEESQDKEGQPEFRCKWPQCGRTNKTKSLLMSHIEIHLTGYTHPCPHCGKIYNTRNCLSSHVSKSCKEKRKNMSI